MDDQMGQAKIKQRAAFTAQLLDEWERDQCVNFAVALARLTGWLLHVDWWSTSTTHREDIPLDQLQPLRVYVGDNRDQIFDARGIKTFVEFNERVLVKLARNIGSGNGGVYTRYYDEAKLWSLPLHSPPDETRIAQAMAAIRANPHFLAAIPARRPPYIPAHHAAQFTYGRCAAFAEAMRDLVGLKPVAMLAVRFSPLFEGTRRGENGYFHSVVLHPDGTAEDSWGKATLNEIASRFGVTEFEINSHEHSAVVERIKHTSGDLFNEALGLAIDLVKVHRLQQ